MPERISRNGERKSRAAGVLDVGLLIAALAVTMVASFRVMAGSAEATNLTWDARHLGTMHTPSVDEDLCTESSNTTRSWSTAQTNVTNALWVEPPSADQKWDAQGYDPASGRYRVWFWAHWSNPCQLLPPAERDPITIEYWLFDNNSAQCGSVTASCAFGSGLYTDDMGHSAYRFYYLYLYAPYTVGEVIPGYYRHQVNHETGHAMGLDDGGAPCPDSVMHTTAYGCAQDRPFPSAGDTSSEVTRIFN